MTDEVDVAFKRALETIEVATVPPDPDAPSCNIWRLRPSEEAAIAMQKYLNPPPLWGLKINLSSFFLGPERCICIGRKLILNNTITVLDISMCDMQEDAAVEFFSCLKRNRYLRHLNVDGNNIGDKGAVAASECIKNLETLHMSCNGIHDDGALAIASSLRSSLTIKTLNLRANRITFYGVFKLVDSLEPILNSLSPDLSEKIREKDPFELSQSDEIKSMSTKFSIQGILEKNEDIVDKNLLEKSVEEKKEIESSTIKYNENLHTLWLRHNDNIPDELFKILEIILAKRYPQPPKGISKRNQKKKSTAKAK